MTPTSVDAATPSTVKHHFLINADPVLEVRANASIVKTPDTVVLFGVDHSTEGPKLEVDTVKVVLVAVRFEESVTVTTYVCEPLAHAVESH